MTTEKVNIHTLLHESLDACKSASTPKEKAKAFVNELRALRAFLQGRLHYSVVFWRISALDTSYQMRHMMSMDYEECREWLAGVIKELKSVEKRTGKQHPVSILAYVDDQLEETAHLANLWDE